MLSSSSSPNSFRKPYQHRAGRDDLADSQQPHEVPRACHVDAAKHIAAFNHCRQHDNAFVVDDRYAELRERPTWSCWITGDGGCWITFGNELTQLACTMKIEHLQHLAAAAHGCNECDLVAVVESPACRTLRTCRSAGSPGASLPLSAITLSPPSPARNTPSEARAPLTDAPKATLSEPLDREGVGCLANSDKIPPPGTQSPTAAALTMREPW